MKNKPSVSVALATFNGSAYLHDQLESLADQEILPIELVVSDDGSEDETFEIIQDFSKKSSFPVKYFQNPIRLGYGRNFLQAASMCSGTHVAFCDQDDVWLPRKISRIISLLKNSDFDLIAHSAKVVDRNLNWEGAKFPDIPLDAVYTHDGSNDHFWPGFTLTISRSLLNLVQAATYSDPHDLKFAHDELICTLARKRKFFLIAEPLALYRQHENNLIGFHGAMQSISKSSKDI